MRIRMGSPVERPPAGPTSLPGNSATERSAAEWVLSVGGAVTVLSASGAEQVEASADLPRGPLRVLSISLVNNRHATDANLSRLAGLEWLERLDLTLTPLTDDGLKHLTGLKRLRDLLLAGTRITSAGVEHLPHLAGPEQVRDRGHGRPHSAPLAGLSLHDTRVDDEGLRFIGRLHRLESLALSGTRVTDGGLSSLSGLENLRSLSLIRTGVGDAGLAHLAKLPRLRELSLQRTFVTANGVGEFQAARPACTIHWNQSPAAARPDAAAGHPGGSTRSAQAAIERAVAEWVITRLGQVKPHHCPDTIGRLSDLPSDNFLIQTIDLWPLKDVDDEDLARLTELAHLQILNLSRTAVSDRGTTELARIRTLTHLQLGHTGITDTGVEHLTELKNLRLLALNGTRVTDAGLRHVSRLAALTYLDLGETGVTSAGLRALRPLTGLHVLLLRGTAVDDEGVAELSAFRELRKLDLGGTRITDASVETLVKLTGLTELTVSDTALTVAGCRRLREGLAGCEVIE